MSLIKCLSCGFILGVFQSGDEDMCDCANETTLIYDTNAIKIRCNDFNKVSVFRESSESFQESYL